MKIRSLAIAGTCGIAMLASITVSGQNRIIRNQGFYYTVEGTIGYGLKMKTDYPLVDIQNDYSPYNSGVKATANVFLNYHVSAGMGLGYSHYTSPDMNTLPLTVNLKYFSGKPARSPFAYVEGGYAFRTDADEQHKGPVYEVGVGYRHQLANRHNFILFKLGYAGFKTKQWIWDRVDLTNLKDRQYQWYYLDRPSINFTVCFYHSTRY